MGVGGGNLLNLKLTRAVMTGSSQGRTLVGGIVPFVDSNTYILKSYCYCLGERAANLFLEITLCYICVHSYLQRNSLETEFLCPLDRILHLWSDFASLCT